VLLSCLVSGCARDALDGPASLLLITVDTLRADRLGAYGHAAAVSPRLDRLAQQSVVFERAFCPIPKTNPSLASLMTGLYPQTHGILELAVPLPAAHQTLAESFAAAGYDTAGIVGQYNLTRRLGFDQGFATYVDDFPPVPPDAEIQGRFAPWAEKRAESVAAAALAWLDRPRDAPFFLWVHFMDPHAAYDPPPSHAPRADAPPDASYPETPLPPGEIHMQAYVPDERALGYYLRHYDAEIRYLDEQIGRVLDRLERDGVADDTWVVLTADHGELLDDRDAPDFVPHFHHGATVSDGETRVPLLVRPPAREARRFAPRRVDEVVSLVDVLPTLNELFGLPAVDADGQSFAGLMAGEPAAAARSVLLYAHETNLVGLRTRDWKLVARPEVPLADYFAGRGPAPAGGGLLLYSDASDGIDHVAREPEARTALLQQLFGALESLRSRRSQRGIEPGAPEDDEAMRARLKALGYL
jgi:arylsulfatase